ncbi:MAG: efflux RND transporter periplasmic adaptor subunit [Saprospiraceae bacterium]|nr:efflux RND transporter periplasmic adaptor subunit [Lewinellaceae bacterium]
MKKKINQILLASLAITMAGCTEKPDSVGNGASPNQVMQADFVVTTPQPVANTIRVNGTLVAAESAMLSAQTAGQVSQILFKEGQRISSGQLLVKLDDRQWLAQKKKLEAQLQTAEKDLKRKEQLLAIKGISQAEVDDAALQIATLKADLQELEVRIDYAAIRAPFTGQVGLRNVSVGAYLSAGTPVAQLVQTDPLKLEFNVPERYASQIRNGQKVRFTLAGSNAEHTAAVYAADPVISESTRALRIRARVPNANSKLIAGAFAEVNLELERIPNALLIPTEAVVPQLNEQVVYQIKNGTIKQVPVQLGIRLARQVQIERGLNPGDTVMVSGLLQARDGMPVQAGKLIAVEKMEE